MNFHEQLMAFCCAGGFAIGRLTAGWSPSETRDQASAIANTLGRLEAIGLVEAYMPERGKNPSYFPGLLVSVGELGATEFGACLGVDATRLLTIVETPRLANQIDLASPSAYDRWSAHAFPDPEYASELLWGDKSLWPNRLAREVGRRLRVAVEHGDHEPDFRFDWVRDHYSQYAQRFWPADEYALADFDLFDVLAGLLWKDDPRLLGAFVRGLEKRGVRLLDVGEDDWTVNTLHALPVYGAWPPKGRQ